MGRMDWNGYRIVTLIYHGKISHHTSPGLADFLHVKEGRHNEEKVLIKEGRHNEKKVLPRHLSRRADTTRKKVPGTYQGGQTQQEKVLPSYLSRRADTTRKKMGQKGRKGLDEILFPYADAPLGGLN